MKTMINECIDDDKLINGYETDTLENLAKSIENAISNMLAKNTKLLNISHLENQMLEYVLKINVDFDINDKIYNINFYIPPFCANLIFNIMMGDEDSDINEIDIDEDTSDAITEMISMICGIFSTSNSDNNKVKFSIKNRIIQKNIKVNEIDKLDFLLDSKHTLEIYITQNIPDIVSNYNEIEEENTVTKERDEIQDLIDGYNPDGLKSIIKNDDKDKLELLIKNGLDFKEHYIESFVTIPLVAIENGSIGILKICIREGVDLEYFKSKAAPCSISVAIKSDKNNLEMVKLLIENGSDINGGVSRRNPLEESIKANQYDITKFLIKSGAKFEINKLNIYGLSPLHDAIFDNNTQLVELLIDNKADINIKSKSGRTPLDIAKQYNCIAEISSLLIKNGAKENIKFFDNNNEEFTNEIFDNYENFLENYIELLTNIKRDGKDKAFYMVHESSTLEMAFLVKFIKYKYRYPDKIESYIKNIYENSRFRDMLLVLVKFYNDESLGYIKMTSWSILVENVEDNKPNNWFNDADKYRKEIQYGKELIDRIEKNGVMSIESEVNNSDIHFLIKEFFNLLVDNTNKETIEKLFNIRKQNAIWFIKDNTSFIDSILKLIGKDKVEYFEENYKYLYELMDYQWSKS